MDHKEVILQLEKIEKNFGGIYALKGVDFQLLPSEVHALLGENGAGKSTLIKIITGVHKPSSGKIILNGKEVLINSPIDARKKGISAIYQELSLIETLTVAENIFLGNEPTFTPLGICDEKKLYRDSDNFLIQFGIKIDSRKKIEELGMGEKRIVEIGKALATNADILLLDEPTTGMSKSEIDSLFKIIQVLKQKNVTMIYISHYLDEVFKVCDRATVFRDGLNVKTFDMKNVTHQELVSAMVGKEVKLERFREIKEHSQDETVLKLTNFKTNIMKKSITLELKESEILGITGIIGAGKSELAQSIFGRFPSKQGEMKIKEEVAHFRNPHDTKKYKIALIPEDRKTQGLFLDQIVSDNIVLSSIEKTQNKMKFLNQKKRDSIAYKICSKLKLQPLDTEMKVKKLSGGNQQKVVIGKWLSADPSIILMDEPTRGIDIGAKSEIYKHIVDFAEQKKSIMIFSSEFDELISICDRIIVLYKGGIVGELIPDKMTGEKLLSLSLGGKDES